MSNEDGMTLSEILPDMAEAAKADPDGWFNNFQCKVNDNRNHWADMDAFYGFYRDWRYRRKPRTITREITYRVPTPMEPNKGQTAYIALPTTPLFYFPVQWGTQPDYEQCCLERGFVHMTKEAAIAHGKQLAGVQEDDR